MENLNEYLVIPLGLTNAPAAFQALVNNVLRDMLNNFVFVYLDDIPIFFLPALQTHQQHVRQVLKWLLHHHLCVKAEKCEFHSPSVSFLGYIITEGEVWVKSEWSWIGLYQQVISKFNVFWVLPTFIQSLLETLVPSLQLCTHSPL